jgi:hypothetical protein
MATKPLKDLPLADLVARVHAEALALLKTCFRLRPLLQDARAARDMPPGERFEFYLWTEDFAERVVHSARRAEEIHGDAGMDRPTALRAHRRVRSCHTSSRRLEGMLLREAEGDLPI